MDLEHNENKLLKKRDGGFGGLSPPETNKLSAKDIKTLLMLRQMSESRVKCLNDLNM